MTRTIAQLLNATSGDDPLKEILLRSDGVMTRARMVNTMLRHQKVDCSNLDMLTHTGIAQLAAVQEMARTGNRSATRSALGQFRGTVTLLRDAYRVILVREDLPGETAQGVLSVAQSLDVTAVKAGIP